MMFLLTSIGAANAEPIIAADQLLATWELRTVTTTMAGKNVKPYGQHPSGYLIHTGDSRAAFLIVADAGASAGSGAPNVSAVGQQTNILLWSASYHADPQLELDGHGGRSLEVTYTIDASSNPQLVGTSMLIDYKIDGDTLIASWTSYSVGAGGATIKVATWERSK